jgi:hypothetical protein
MPYTFGRRSRERLANVDEGLVEVLYDAINVTPYDFGISFGHRSIAEQDELYAQGRTKPGDIVTWARGGQSRHNDNPSTAVDFIVVPLDWKDHWRFGFICGLIYKCAVDRDLEVEFLPHKGDYGHVQLKK